MAGCELSGKSVVVNLARRPDRRDATVELFEKTGIKDYSFFTAVDGMELTATDEIKELFAGRSKTIHETMLAIERADSSLKLMMQVRNKVLDAYREIMRMQV
jgi:GR25 family glycosyltransferase involved in LPS biosynthesis